MARVSIIIPAYKVESFIVRSLKSVIRQSHSDFEVLVVIDGSPDRSEEQARLIEDPRIKVYVKPHGGLSDTRNFGLERATGEYIYFLDSDDWIEKDLLRDNLAVMKRQDLNVICFGYWSDVEDNRGALLSKTTVVPRVRAFQKAASQPLVDAYHLGLMGYAWNKIYKRSFLDRNGLRFEKGISLIEDILFNLEAFEKLEKISFNRKPYYHYVNRPRQTLINQFRPHVFDLIEQKIEAIEHFAKVWNLPNKKRLLGEAVIQGLNYVIFNIFECRNELSLHQRKDLLKKILNTPVVIEGIRNYKSENMEDRRYKSYIQRADVMGIINLKVKKHRTEDGFLVE